MKRNTIPLLQALSWLGLIWFLSSLPSNSVPSVKIWSFDKFAHFIIYLILGLLFNRYLKEGKLGFRKCLYLYLALVLAAGLDEWHQNFIPGRSVTIYDFLANFSGLLCAFILHTLPKPQVK